MFSKKINGLLLVIIVWVLTTVSASANQSNKSISYKELQALTQSISNSLRAEYIFPGVALEISKVLKKNLENGVYNKYKDPMTLSEKLTEDIRSVNGDSHLNVLYTPQSGGMKMVRRGGPGGGANSQMLKRLSRDNFGFQSVQILEGNIGYVNLTSMVNPTYAGDTAAAAMQYLFNTDAIIFDLRENRGGSGEMYQLLASYFFDEGPVQLNEIYWPGEDRRYQTWTLPHLPGKRMPNKDLYILTSSATGSAAEVFSYTLKHHERATIVGEVTVGVANPVSPTKISEEYTVLMSKGESKHPVTKTNFEGKGVKPHVETSKAEALIKAHTIALSKLSEREGNDRNYFEWYQEIVMAKSALPRVDNKLFHSYKGTYVNHAGDNRFIQVKNGKVWYGANENELTEMLPLTQTRFMIPGDNSFKLELVIDNNEVTGINRLFSSGRVIQMNKL